MILKRNTTRPLALCALVALSLSASACNTVKGLGEDISSVGETGEEVIND
ncbi:MAG: Entericidin EcnA/B family protein [Pseudomonadota bacterium]